MKEQNIKLFGREIFLTEECGESSDESSGGRKGDVEDQDNKIVNTSSDSDNDGGAPVIDENGERNCKPKLKKPDKILPCPRCNSSDTKFCYYNNYNIKQPRHFCKSCQRYWTAGGTMRNVPVGAGKRKSKNSASHYPHITISDTFLAERIGDSANGNIKFEQNGTVLTFGRNPNSIQAATPIAIPNPKSIPPAPLIPWTFPWNATVPIPIPIPIITAPPYWNSNLTNSALGKHSRNGDIKPTNPIVVPKTLRIDDPEEAAKSSIWSTLGINVNSDQFSRKKSVFHGLRPMNDKETMAAVSPLLHANPAALSRSMIFRETA